MTLALCVWQGAQWVFDINAGWTSPADWKDRVVPALLEGNKRATGGWFATHRWWVERRA